MIGLPALSVVKGVLGQFWPYIAIGVLSLLCYALYERGNAAKAQLEVFVSATEMVGKQAAAYNKGVENGWKDRVKIAEANSGPAWATLNGWVRKNNTRGSTLPASTGTPKGTDRTGQICFDEAALDGALRRFTGGIEAIIGEGQAGVIDAKTLLEAWPQR